MIAPSFFFFLRKHSISDFKKRLEEKHQVSPQLARTEDEMAGCRHRCEGHESEQAPGVADGRRGLAGCSPWGREESDTTERLNWTAAWWRKQGGRGTLADSPPTKLISFDQEAKGLFPSLSGLLPPESGSLQSRQPASITLRPLFSGGALPDLIRFFSS